MPQYSPRARSDAGDAARRPASLAFLIFLLFAASILALSIAPFIGAALWAMAATIIFGPVERHLRARLRLSARTASGLTVAIIALAIVTPAGLLIGIAADQAIALANRAQNGDLGLATSLTKLIVQLPEWLQAMLKSNGISDGRSAARALVSQVGTGSVLAHGLIGAGRTIAGILLGIFVTLYLTYFMLLDGNSIRRRMAWLIPMRAEEQAMLAARFAAVVRATVMGSLVIGVAQGASGGVVMALLGVQNAALLGVLMAFASLVPGAGTGLVWVPVVLYLMLGGDLIRAGAMAFSGLFLIGSVDTLLRPILVRRATRVPDGLVLVTTLGGASMFGFNGVLIGPMSAALFLAGWVHLARHRFRARPR